MTRLLPIAYAFYALAFRNRQARSAMKGYLQTYIDLLARLIEKGIDDGDFQPGRRGKNSRRFRRGDRGGHGAVVNLEEQLNHSFGLLLAGMANR